MGEPAEWIALTLAPNLGPRRIARVFRETGSIDSFFSAQTESLSQILNIKQDAIKAVLRAIDLQKGRALVKLCRDRGVAVTTLDSPDYPDLLREIYDPPPVLYYRGQLPGTNLVAAVGSRKATRYGRTVTARLIPELCRAGLGIVSGLAVGIDACAQWAALNAGGYTAAVLGNGVDIYYPAVNTQLQNAILEKGGCLLSEFPPGCRPRADHFPRRNRIICGLCRGVLVVEAGLKSGAMITVSYALEQGRDVFAVPGNIDSPQSAGTNHLIGLGAKPILSSADILEEYGLDLPLIQQPRQAMDLGAEEKNLLAYIDEQGVSADELCYLTGLPGGVIMAKLASLELKGAVARLPGLKYVRRADTEV